MKCDFCTLTDKNYVYKWLALCNSIETHISRYTIWVLCLDDESEILIRRLDKKNVEIVNLSHLRDTELERVRSSRTKQEFAWTCKPSIMSYILGEKNVAAMIFVDADMLFYSSPEPLFQKYTDASIMITSHKFSEKKQYIADIVGYYNSGFIIFRNDGTSRACVRRWKNQCIEWCYNFHDKGRHGDQSYLKSWPQDFKNVEEISEKGANLGTWNLERYTVRKKRGEFYIDDEKLICYHFHGLVVYLEKHGILKPYPATVHQKEIYKIYLKELQKAYNEIIAVDPSWHYGFAGKLSLLRRIKQQLTQNTRIVWQYIH
ncbi:MAG: hypothetical protein HY007_02975 [Candidatus Sungbacteria bacterium]|nr:hypothetical protein [Candidatus Sungbacteria bacterium]